MKVFRFSLVMILAGLLFTGWLFLDDLVARPFVFIGGMLSASLVALGIGIYVCYQIYSGTAQLPSDKREARPVALTEIIATIPLLVGVILTIYSLRNNQIRYIAEHS